MRSTQPITSETELIQTYLAPLSTGAPGALGLRDDAAFFTPPPGKDIVVTTDPIVANVHFFPDQRADDIAWKALAVNVSDLAAKGATLLGYTLALSFPDAPTRAWMEQFSQGLASAQKAFGGTLLGGDTDRTPGPLSISITVFGTVPRGRMVRRNGASCGDVIFVTGTLGDAALGLSLQREPQAFANVLTSGDAGFLTGRYLRPAPRIGLAPLLLEFASGALDISDGLAKDLNRLAVGADLHARVAFDALPLSPPARTMIATAPHLVSAVISGGDDYEILFAVPSEREDDLKAASASLPFNVTRIGELNSGVGVSIIDAQGAEMPLGVGGYDHFA